jgi:hypothetical protein
MAMRMLRTLPRSCVTSLRVAVPIGGDVEGRLGLRAMAHPFPVTGSEWLVRDALAQSGGRPPPNLPVRAANEFQPRREGFALPLR